MMSMRALGAENSAHFSRRGRERLLPFLARYPLRFGCLRFPEGGDWVLGRLMGLWHRAEDQQHHGYI